GLGVDLRNLSCDRRRYHRLHLHRFEDYQHVADLDHLSALNRDPGDRTRTGAAADLAFIRDWGGALPHRWRRSGRSGRGNSDVSQGRYVGGVRRFRLEDLDVDFVYLAVHGNLELQNCLLVGKSYGACANRCDAWMVTRPCCAQAAESSKRT